MNVMIASAPDGPGSAFDSSGRTVNHPEDFTFNTLDDGTGLLARISKQLARSRVMRIVYANPRLLGLVELIYGPKFVPFDESIVIKLPENGSEVPYHQDGKTHYEIKCRGLNLGIYLHPSTEANGCLRAIPGSHLEGLSNVAAMREDHGPILPGSETIKTKAGDVVLHDRSIIHGSLPNTSSDLRITVYFGFHKLKSIQSIYDEPHIMRRAQVVSLCIKERVESGRFPTEKSFRYALANRAPAPVDPDEVETVLRIPPLHI